MLYTYVTSFLIRSLRLVSAFCPGSEDIVLELKAKQVQFERIISEFQYTTSESYVQLCLYKTALSTCELLVTGRAFLFPNIYRQFMDYLADGNIDLVGARFVYLRVGC